VVPYSQAHALPLVHQQTAGLLLDLPLLAGRAGLDAFTASGASIPSDFVGRNALLRIGARLVLRAPRGTYLHVSVAPLFGHVVETRTGARCQERKDHNSGDSNG
jgi:hypothetical protein